MRHMADNHQNSVELSGEEFTTINEFARSVWERGLSGNPPDFVIFMGGVGTGKTTLRRQNYADGFVHFDFGEIYTALKKIVGENNPKLMGYSVLASDLILRACIEAKKNIVIEIIGDNEQLITPIIDKMKEIGYNISIQAITADVEESYKRHLQAVEKDPDYLSAFHTQEATLASLNYFFNSDKGRG